MFPVGSNVFEGLLPDLVDFFPLVTFYKSCPFVSRRSQEPRGTKPPKQVGISHGRIHGHLERGRILRVDVVASGYVAAKLPYPSVLMPELASNRALQAKKSRATGAQDQVQSHPAGCAQPEGAQRDVGLRVHDQDAVLLPQLIPHRLMEKSKVRT